MGDLTSVLWIGGPPASGKTTIARLLARRHGLRWYNADAHTWEHRDRAIAAGHPAALRFEQLPIAERWTLPMADRLAMSLHHERGPLVVDDLRDLPSKPLTVAEGTPVTPSVAGYGGRAVWLLPEPGLQRARLVERGLPNGVRELYEHLLHVISAQVEECGARRLIVDGSQSVEDTVAEMERLFAEALADGHTATTALERRTLLRYANYAIVSQYLTFFTRPWARSLGDIRTTVLEFSCECASVGCEEQVKLAVADFPRQNDDTSVPVLAPGHAPA
ncbi:hypothetical protein ACWGCW_15890 [Streptomyces sp. NPDC054933]|jgi:hypothetical protein